MIKYIVDNRAGDLISIDTENLDNVKSLRSDWMIDYTYIINEDGKIIVKDGDIVVNTLDVKANDVLLKLYSPTGDGKREFVVLSSDQIRDYVIRKKEFEAKQKEERKANQCCGDCVSCSCKEVSTDE